MLENELRDICKDFEKRRENLLYEMNSLGKSSIDCAKCTGRCCTFVANSMQVTPLETLDLYFYLKGQNQLNEETLKNLQTCIDEFRLDKELSTGKNSTFRRTYTCPFFMDCSLGCSISPEQKPYGCLAFNPKSTGIKEGEDCASNLDVLEEREKLVSDEESRNEQLRKTYQFYWEKLPIPNALLEVHRALKL